MNLPLKYTASGHTMFGFDDYELGLLLHVSKTLQLEFSVSPMLIIYKIVQLFSA